MEIDNQTFEQMTKPKYKMNQNILLTELLDNEILILCTGIENLQSYSPAELIQICHAFNQIRDLISRNYFIEKFLRDEQIKFIAGKISNLYDELTFLKEENNIGEKFFSHLFFVLAFAQNNELYECEANLYKYLMEYFAQDFINEKIKYILS